MQPGLLSRELFSALNLKFKKFPGWRFFGLEPALALVISLLAAGVARGQHHVEYGLDLSLGADFYSHYEQGVAPVGPVSFDDRIDGYGSLSGVANVGFGVNKARIAYNATNFDNPVEFDYGFASSRYWDSFQFSDPVLNGTHGFFDATLFVAGSGATVLTGQYLSSPDTDFDAFWHAVVNVTVNGVTDTNGSPIQSGYYAGEWAKPFGESVLGYSGDPLNTYQQTVTFEFIYGQPILMDTFLQVDIEFDNQTYLVPGTLSSEIDLGNSSYWGGIQRLRDARGNLVTNASYSSSSGTDYRLNALPRPSLSIVQSASSVQLIWTGPFRLQSAPNPQGPYTTVTNATSPHPASTTAPRQYFRLVSQ